MKKILLGLTLALLSAVASAQILPGILAARSSGVAPIVLGNYASTGGSCVGSPSVCTTGTATVVAGDLSIAAFIVGFNSAVTSVVGSCGDTYAPVQSASHGILTTYIYAKVNATACSNATVAVSLAGSEGGFFHLANFHGINTVDLATALDDTAIGSQGPAQTFSTGTTGTLDQTNELVFVVGGGEFLAGVGVDPVQTDVSGYQTPLYASRLNGLQTFLVSYKIVSATTAVSYNGWDAGESIANGATVLATFKGN